jgi:hypothetical protein
MNEVTDTFDYLGSTYNLIMTVILVKHEDPWIGSASLPDELVEMNIGGEEVTDPELEKEVWETYKHDAWDQFSYGG